jgi:dihydropteroate synthase
MQDAPTYENVVEEIEAYLQQRAVACQGRGIAPERICLDPGIGFGKTHAHNLELLRGVRRFLQLPYPILIGHSRKGFIAHVLDDRTVDRDAGTLGVSLAMAAAGVDLLRVHNVPATVQALRLFQACRTPSGR